GGGFPSRGHWSHSGPGKSIDLRGRFPDDSVSSLIRPFQKGPMMRHIGISSDHGKRQVEGPISHDQEVPSGATPTPEAYWQSYGMSAVQMKWMGDVAMPTGYWAAYGLDGMVQRRGSGGEIEPAQVLEAARRGVGGAGQTLPHLEQIQRSF